MVQGILVFPILLSRGNSSRLTDYNRPHKRPESQKEALAWHISIRQENSLKGAALKWEGVWSNPPEQRRKD